MRAWLVVPMCLALFSLALPLHAASTTWHTSGSQTTVALSGESWSGTSFPYSVHLSNGESSDYVCGFNWGFSLDPGSLITHVRLRFTARKNGVGPEVYKVRLRFNSDNTVFTPTQQLTTTFDDYTWTYSQSNEAYTVGNDNSQEFSGCIAFDVSSTCADNAATCAAHAIVNNIQAKILYDVDLNYCSGTPSTTNGYMTDCPDASYQRQCTRNCNLGYYLSTGSSTIKCLVGGWDDPLVGVCSKRTNYCPGLSFSFGNTHSCGDQVGDSCQYTCDPGYQATTVTTGYCTGDQPATGVYKTSGGDIWVPGCTRITNYCALPSGSATELARGAFTATCNRYVQGTCGWECNRGYVAGGSAAHGPWTCGTNAQYSPAPTLDCNIVSGYCTVPTVDHGSLSACSGNIGENCRPSCNTGYERSHDTYRECQAGSSGTGHVAGNGAWSGAFATCDLIPGFCDPLSPPAGATASSPTCTGATAQLGDVCNRACRLGFNSFGSASRTCQSNTLWSGSTFGCSKFSDYCPTVTDDVPNSAVSGTCFGRVETTCTLVCNAGYAYLSGSGPLSRYCSAGANNNLGSGDWTDAPICNPIDDYCSTLGPPTHGALSAGTCSGTGAQIDSTCGVFSCNEGFSSAGSASRTCAVPGQWSGTAMTCSYIDEYCTLRSVPNTDAGACNGHVDELCTLHCSNGYHKSNSGNNHRRCTANGASGFWSGTEITCARTDDYCASLSAPANGQLSATQCTGAGARIDASCGVFSCNNGYTMTSGTTTRTCLEGTAAAGVWSGTENTCSRFNNYCDAPSVDVTNAHTVGSCLGRIGDSCTIACNFGYHLSSGAATRVCSDNTVAAGAWTETPVCTLTAGYCADQTAPTHGNLTDTICTDTTAELGDVCGTFVCNAGYTLAGPSSRECLPNDVTAGLWSDVEPTCPLTDDYCPEPTDPEGSVAVCDRRLHTTCTFDCLAGFEYNNDTFPWASHRCAVAGHGPGAGVWAPAFPTPICRAQPCTHLIVPPVNGTASLAQGFTHDNVTFECNDGFTLVGSAVSRCLRDHQWSTSEPVCEPLPCPALDVVGNATISPALHYNGTTDDVRVYTCNQGYVLRGAARLKCIPSGPGMPVWDLPEPYCEPLPCSNLTTPGNGTLSGTTGVTGTRRRFDCNTGYHFVGTQKTVRCNESSHWTPMFETIRCADKVCAPPLGPPFGMRDSGVVSSANATTLQWVRYICNQGFYLQDPGLARRQCSVYGNWTGARATCLPEPCLETLVSPADGVVNATTGVTRDVVSYSCNLGFFLNAGNQQRTCQPDNTWSGKAPRCDPLPCPVTLRAPRNGRVDRTSGRTRDVATYSCNAGYEIQGSATTTCDFDSTWTTPRPACVLIPHYCPPFEAPPNGYLLANPKNLEDPQPFAACDRRMFTNCSHVVCNEGYEITGNTWRVCDLDQQRTGRWRFDIDTNCTQCLPGTYPVEYPEQLTWRCDPCPLGGRCDGFMAQPVAADGWWENPRTGGFLACVPAENCVNGYCRTGHEGYKCNICVSGYYKKDGEHCIKCPPSKEIIYPILIVLAILLCILLVYLAKRSTHYFASLAVGASFLQMISVLPSFKIKWPSYLEDFFRLFSFMSLDISHFFEPKCMVNRGSSAFVTVWAIKMSLPLIFTAIFASGALLCVVYYFLRPRPPLVWIEKVPRLAQYLPRVSRSQILIVLWATVNAYLTCLVLCYIVVSSSALSIFGCTRQQDGAITMNAEPALECHTKTWNTMVAFSVVGLVFFSVGFPIVIWLVLRYVRYDLWKEFNIIRFGLLYQRYLRRFYWFELALLFRKFMFVFGKAVFPSYPVGQVAWALGAVLVGAVVQKIIEPFRDPLVNRLELFHLICAAIVLMLGIVFHETDQELSEDGRNTLGIFIITLIAINILIIFVAVVMALKQQWRLMRQGVTGGYASDELQVTPIFFDKGMSITHKERFADAHSMTWSLGFAMEHPLPLRVHLCQEEIDLGATASQVLHDVEGDPTRYARLQSSPDGATLDLWVLLPCPGVYSVRLLVDEDRIADPAQLEALAERAKVKSGMLKERESDAGGILVVDFFLGCEIGAQTERQRLVDASHLVDARAGMVIRPACRVIETHREYVFHVGAPRASSIHLQWHPAETPEHELTLAPEHERVPFFITGGPSDVREARYLARPGLVTVWGAFPPNDALQQWGAARRPSANFAGAQDEFMERLLVYEALVPAQETEAESRARKRLETYDVLSGAIVQRYIPGQSTPGEGAKRARTYTNATLGLGNTDDDGIGGVQMAPLVGGGPASLSSSPMDGGGAELAMASHAPLTSPPLSPQQPCAAAPAPSPAPSPSPVPSMPPPATPPPSSPPPPQPAPAHTQAVPPVPPPPAPIAPAPTAPPPIDVASLPRPVTMFLTDDAMLLADDLPPPPVFGGDLPSPTIDHL